MKFSMIRLLCACIALAFLSCSKSSNTTTTVTGPNPGNPLFPLAVNNTWNYKLKHYDTATGNVTDSSFFTLSIATKFTANGTTYYQFQDPVDTTTMVVLGNTSNTAVGSIDSVGGISDVTFFVSGTGDSTIPVSTWPVNLSSGGSICQGTDRLFAYYADTTLVNIDGTTFTQSIKNTILTYNCSGARLYANVYFIKQGLGLVRFSRYIYDAAGNHLLQSAWVLESETLN